MKNTTLVWPRRWAIGLSCAVMLAIVVGAAATTCDAGRAIPDWPSTFGHFLFLYPWSEWAAAPQDVFLVHGHRLLALGATLLAVAVAAVVVRCDGRRRVRFSAATLLGAIILEDLLGGMRLLWDQRVLAPIHAYTGFLVLAACAALGLVMSQRWTAAAPAAAVPPGSASGSMKLGMLPVLVAAAIDCQVLIGVFLRHIPLGASPDGFRLVVFLHLLGAATVLSVVLLLMGRAWRRAGGDRLERRLARLLGALVAGQMGLGCATWIVNFYWPAWAADWAVSARYDTIVAHGPLQLIITTAHVVNGSAVFGVSLLVVFWSLRVARSDAREYDSSS